MPEIRKLKIEDAKICSKNFEGRANEYNTDGRRYFSVILDEDTALELIDDGWNVDSRHPREEGDPTRYYLKVRVKFEKFPPVVKQVTSRGVTTLDEDEVKLLDGATITSADLVITPYNWTVGKKTGVTAYLKTGYFKIEEDEFASKYEHNTASDDDELI